MNDWVLAAIPYFKAVHIVGLCLWCGALVAMPLMLSRHDPAVSQDDYRRIRKATHLTYTLCVTPAAVITVIAGTWLIFMRETYVPWFYAKLVFVMLMVMAHMWIGTTLVSVAESKGRERPPIPLMQVAAVLIPAVCILTLVLAKPELREIQLPSWLSEPVGGDLPFDVPRL